MKLFEWLKSFKHEVRESNSPQELPTSFGSVKEITWTAGWAVVANRQDYVSVRPTERPQSPDPLGLHVQYRNPVRASSSAKAFEKILQEPAHVLSAEEIESLNLANTTSGYTISDAETKDFNGQRVLQLKGQHQDWYKGMVVDSITIIIKPDSSGRVQEISYLAMPQDFAAYFDAAMSALTSIRWSD